jgi:hypothetical protein
MKNRTASIAFVAFCGAPAAILAFVAIEPHKRPMPTLTRLIAFIAVIAALVYGAMVALATFVEPTTQEMSVEIPASRLNPVPAAPPAEPQANPPQE